MNTETKATRGGFAGDPAEAFTPPAANGCCGSPASTTASSGAPATSTCCGTLAAATAAGTCCDPVAKTEAVAAGAGCCG